jgi:hypothetical protein
MTGRAPVARLRCCCDARTGHHDPSHSPTAGLGKPA